MRATLVRGFLLLSTTVNASEPGQPLDCSDWVFLEPGYSCLQGQFQTVGANGVTDNDGGVLFVGRGSTLTDCGTSYRLQEIGLNRVGEQGTTLIGYIRERCVGTDQFGYGMVDQIKLGREFEGWANGALLFFEESGRLSFPLSSTCNYRDGHLGNCVYGTAWNAIVGGFTTEFEILQSYTPTGSWSFRVPFMPEGLTGAAYFDTYYGPLTKPIDFSLAHGMRCGYPSSPVVGDYLEVGDTVPTPAPGQGVYYVTAVTHQGQTRYGRKASGAVLSGRDPAALAACAASP